MLAVPWPKGAKAARKALLPKNTAYQFRAAAPAVVVLQTCKGELSVERWSDIYAAIFR